MSTSKASTSIGMRERVHAIEYEYSESRVQVGVHFKSFFNFLLRRAVDPGNCRLQQS